MASYDGPIIDTDVHQTFKRDSDVIAYLPERWQEYFKLRPDGRRLLSAPRPSNPMGVSGMLSDSVPADGSPAGSDYQFMREQLLDKYGMYRAVITHLGGFATHTNQELAAALCSAANDWNIEHWLSLGDERIYSVLEVPWALPEVAVKEVRRHGAHPHMEGVFLAGNPTGKPIGDPIFHPVYEAMADMGLILAVHISQGERPNHHFGGIGERVGPSDHWPFLGHQATHYLSSLIVNGVFEKYPSLKVLFIEYGVGWIPAAIWRLDEVYDLLKLESSWVRKRPSEYINKHVRFSTQPLDESRDDKAAIGHLLEQLEGAEDLFCFSTDYPHFTFDDPITIQRMIPTAWQRKIFCDNACDLFGWERPAATFTPKPVPSRAG